MSPPPPDQPPVETILYRLEVMEQRRAEDRRHLDAAVAELKSEMRAGIASIAYVSKEQFADFKATVAKEMADNRDAATEARKLSLACLWVLIVAVVGGVVGVAFQVAS
jgi:hypothetical protein